MLLSHITLSHCHTVTLSHSLSHCHTSHWHTVTLSHCHTVTLSHCHPVSPAVDVIAPGESVLPEQEPGVASQGAEHEEDAGDDPSWEHIISMERLLSHYLIWRSGPPRWGSWRWRCWKCWWGRGILSRGASSGQEQSLAEWGTRPRVYDFISSAENIQFCCPPTHETMTNRPDGK